MKRHKAGDSNHEIHGAAGGHNQRGFFGPWPPANGLFAVRFSLFAKTRRIKETFAFTGKTVSKKHEIGAKHCEIHENSSVCFAHIMVFVMALFSAMFVWAGEGGQVASATDPRWAILVAGSSGDPALQKQYLKELVDLRGLLESSLGFPSSHVFTLFDNPNLDPTRIQYQSTRENLAKVCKDIAGRAGKEDIVFIFLEGHGSSDGKVYKLNLVGPDPTVEDLAVMFYSIPTQRFIVVNATSCSGGSVEALSGKGRVVVASTKSANEKIVTRLGRYFIEAFVGNNADVDKNSRISIFEAFNYAARKVEEYYTKEASLQTEHPVLSDNGDPQVLTLEGMGARATLLSRSAYLDRGSPLLAGDSSPEGQALAKEGQALEKQIELLKSAKDEMTEAEYEKKLEELLLKLAEVQAKLRKK